MLHFIASHGVYAVFAVMALDAVLPVGGELTMLYAGALASGALADRVTFLGTTLPTGLESYVVLVAAGALGYLVGSLIGWEIGRRGGRPLIERHGRWLHLSPAKLERAERWFDRHGVLAVFLGRLTPLVRSFISIPAGVLGAPLGRYTVLTLAASLIWCLAFAGAGWIAGSSWESVHHAFRYVDYLAVGIVVGLLIVAAVVLLRRRASAVRS
jgi:membrane protein DedA with SNARE-associated domain